MADTTKIVDTDAMHQALPYFQRRWGNLESIKNTTTKNLDTLALHFDADSAREYHKTMSDWTAQYDLVIQALDAVIVALGGTVKHSTKTEYENKTSTQKLIGSMQSLTLPI